MTTYPLPTLAPTIDATGISAPPYNDILLSLQASYRIIYGQDIDLDPDTQDGQMLAIFASAINDENAAIIACYNAFSPATAQGAGLASIVQINGLQKLVATESSVIISVGGQVGRTINNGVVGDNTNLGTQWALPASVTIPPAGTVDVLATCTEEGAINALPATLTVILNPQLGWQTANNAAAATPGAPVESDPALRQRQAISTGKPAQTPLAAIKAAVLNVPGVSGGEVYENDTSTTDTNGIPAHSIAVVVAVAGLTAPQAVIDAIGSKKNPGTGTAGSSSGTYVDPAGVDDTINYYILTTDRIIVSIAGDALPGYADATTKPIIQAAVAAYINSRRIGADVYLANVSAAATLPGNPLADTFDIVTVEQSIYPAAVTAANIIIPFNAQATCQPSDVAVAIS
jgi:uncharacterized phage protein gp47/JayE